ncbi:MAG TPA: amidase family protein [Gemmatimonadaceae bacterium]|nr:amidase family protein [Gemmatimonadaceae bacterium]
MTRTHAFRPHSGAPLVTPLLALTLAFPLPAQRPPAFHVEEATIAQIESALHDRRITCRALVEQYMRRIDAYDRKGPAINAIILVNPAATATADSLDRLARAGKSAGPLHCVPIIVKDNFDTYDLPTTAGSLSLSGAQPMRDAPVVARLRAAGAIVLAKSNMAEFAFSPYETVSSILGTTKNPYALDRVPAGSSGGTAAAVASSFGAVGLGTDTGNSIRGPSSHDALVGIRPTMGLTSRAGVVPLDLGADVTGPIARTVADAVAVLQVMAGPDSADPVTLRSAGRVPASYSASLKTNGLRGARVGVLRAAYESPTTDSEIVHLFNAALDDLRKQGATIVDSVAIDSLAQIRRSQRGNCQPFKWELNAYLAAQGPHVPVHSLDEIIQSGHYDPSIGARLKSAQSAAQSPDTNPACTGRDAYRQRLDAAITRTMDTAKLDALVYPTWSNPPRLIGDLRSPAGDNNQFYAPSSGFPAITVPMGYTRGDSLPAGLQFFGRGFDEATLIRLAYSYEQATKHRRAPASVPPM